MDRIFLIGGAAGAGKDTFAAGFSEDWRRFAVASVIKDEVAEKYCLPRRALDTQEGKEAEYEVGSGRYATGRQLLIAHGQAARDLDPDVWARKLAERIRDSGCRLAVVTDFRFPNEFWVLVRAFPRVPVRTARVSRPGLAPPPFGNDPTETSLRNFLFDYYVMNDGSVEQLHTRATYIEDEVLYGSPTNASPEPVEPR